MKNVTNFRVLMFVAVCFMVFLLAQIYQEQRLVIEPVYYKPAGAPDSIPCSSSTNSRCMEYYPL